MSVHKSQDFPSDLQDFTSDDMAPLSRSEKLQKIPVSALVELRKAGKKSALQTIESALQKEAEEKITDEIGLDDYLPPSKFLIPKPGTKSRSDAILQKNHGGGPENGIYRSDVNSVVISTDFGKFNGAWDFNLLSTAFHELIHNDTYNRLTGADEVLHHDQIAGIEREIEDITAMDLYDEAEELFDIDTKDSIINEMCSEYKISKFELTQLSQEARDEISCLSEKYNSSSQDGEDILQEAYKVVQADTDIYHLNSPETQPEKESFAWLGSMYLEGDIETERNSLDSDFLGYDKGREIKEELKSLVGVYDNLREHADMESEEAMKYILEEVQPRKFDYKASIIRESLEN